MYGSKLYFLFNVPRFVGKRLHFLESVGFVFFSAKWIITGQRREGKKRLEQGLSRASYIVFILIKQTPVQKGSQHKDSVLETLQNVKIMPIFLRGFFFCWLDLHSALISYFFIAVFRALLVFSVVRKLYKWWARLKLCLETVGWKITITGRKHPLTSTNVGIVNFLFLKSVIPILSNYTRVLIRFFVK